MLLLLTEFGGSKKLFVFYCTLDKGSRFLIEISADNAEIVFAPTNCIAACFSKFHLDRYNGFRKSVCDRQTVSLC